MDQAVADRVSDARLANRRMPRGGWQLTGDERGRPFTPIFDDLQQIATLGIGERRQEPIVDRQQIELGPFREESRIRPIAATDRDSPWSSRGARTCVTLPPCAARALHERRRQPAFPDPGWPAHQQIVMIADPRAGAETQDHLPRQSPGRRKIHSSSAAPG